jgi:hypothetical protein
MIMMYVLCIRQGAAKKQKKQLRIAKVFVNMEYQGKYTLLCVFYPAGWWPWK